jgi:hypothetical protein
MNQAPTNQPGFTNDASAEERAEMLKSEREQRQLNTRVAMSSLLDPEFAGGRFARPSMTVGDSPAPQYPAAQSPWAGPQVPEEPPFPVDISYVEVCGEPFEAERATHLLSVADELAVPLLTAMAGSPPPARQHEVDPLASPGSAEATPSSATASSPDVVTDAVASPPLSKPWRRFG